VASKDSGEDDGVDHLRRNACNHTFPVETICSRVESPLLVAPQQRKGFINKGLTLFVRRAGQSKVALSPVRVARVGLPSEFGDGGHLQIEVELTLPSEKNVSDQP